LEIVGKGIEGVKSPNGLCDRQPKDMSVGGLSLHSTARASAETTAPQS